MDVVQLCLTLLVAVDHFIRQCSALLLTTDSMSQFYTTQGDFSSLTVNSPILHNCLGSLQFFCKVLAVGYLGITVIKELTNVSGYNLTQ